MLTTSTQFSTRQLPRAEKCRSRSKINSMATVSERWKILLDTFGMFPRTWKMCRSKKWSGAPSRRVRLRPADSSNFAERTQPGVNSLREDLHNERNYDGCGRLFRAGISQRGVLARHHD